MLVLASVTDSLVTFATHVIRDLGLPGVFLLVAADALGVPIAAGAILLFAGFNVDEGHSTVLGVIIAGTLGDVVGASIAFAIGWYGRTELLEKHGKKLHITPAKLAQFERWFDRYGSVVVSVGRLVPFVRTYSSYPAGAARMAYGRFVVLTTLGAIVLAVTFTLIGKQVGHNWVHWKHALHYVDYIVLALVALGIAYLVLRWWRGRGRPGGDAATETA